MLSLPLVLADVVLADADSGAAVIAGTVGAFPAAGAPS
jgi:hypothetical protein